jgi:glycosyltransferase involved in cell wall biosynthesis
VRRLRVALDARKLRDFGIGTYLRGVLGAAAARGGHDLVAIVKPGDEPLLPPGVEAIPCGAAGYSLSELVAVGRVIARARCDVFHAPHYVVPLFPPRATVVTIHDLIHLKRPEHGTVARRLYATTMLRRALRAARVVLTVSEAVRRDLDAFAPEHAAKVRAVANGVEARFLADVAAAEVDRMRGVFGLDGPYVLFLGNDKPHKNLGGLLAAFARVVKAELPHRLVLAGGAPERHGDRLASARSAGVADRLVDLGVLPGSDVVPLLAGASALVLPSFLEGFGLPVLEAQAVGTPVVCSDRGGLPEAGGEAALYADPDDPGALGEVIRRLLSDPALAASLSARGRERARTFTWDATFDTVDAAWRDAAEVP